MRPWVKRLLYAFFPRRCLYCDRVIAPDESLCEDCAPAVPRMEEPCCKHCGCTKSLCRCKKHRHAFDTAVAAMRYEGPVKQVLLRLKQECDDDVTATMAEEMVSALRRRTDAAALEAVTFVPMTARDERRREFNQSECLAREVGALLGVPVKPLLRKIYSTAPQKGLPMMERSGNVLGVFDVNLPLTEKKILLVDDLFTTGATLHECAKMLKLYGAETVTALTFAATVPSEKQDAESDS